MAWTQQYQGDEPQRVNRWLGQSGVCSRRDAEGLISQGLVSIDGEVIADVGRKILPGQTLTLNDQAGAQLASAITVLIHKPVGVVSAHPEPHQLSAARFLTADNYWGPEQAVALPDPDLPPVGRLDLDSRGLLLLSDDGVVAKSVIGPTSEIDKAYQVEVQGMITPGILRQLRHGLWLDGRPLRPAEVSQTDEQQLAFILTEGRNRQIRRMCRLVGLTVIDLYRHRVGPLKIGDLPEGRWRFLTQDERARLTSSPA
jgi:23S rRNA pseudouridine2604 synthase